MAQGGDRRAFPCPALIVTNDGKLLAETIQEGCDTDRPAALRQQHRHGRAVAGPGVVDIAAFDIRNRHERAFRVW